MWLAIVTLGGVSGWLSLSMVKKTTNPRVEMLATTSAQLSRPLLERQVLGKAAAARPAGGASRGCELRGGGPPNLRWPAGVCGAGFGLFQTRPNFSTPGPVGERFRAYRGGQQDTFEHHRPWWWVAPWGAVPPGPSVAASGHPACVSWGPLTLVRGSDTPTWHESWGVDTAGVGF